MITTIKLVDRSTVTVDVLYDAQQSIWTVTDSRGRSATGPDFASAVVSLANFYATATANWPLLVAQSAGNVTPMQMLAARVRNVAARAVIASRAPLARKVTRGAGMAMLLMGMTVVSGLGVQYLMGALHLLGR